MTDEGKETSDGSHAAGARAVTSGGRQLLAVSSIGRLAVITQEGLPFVVPVNYALDGESVVFRTDFGTKFDSLLRHPVAFQVDSIDPESRSGWTVLIQGIAHEMTPHEAQHLAVEPWVGPKQHWLRIVPRHISGRRIERPEHGRPMGSAR